MQPKVGQSVEIVSGPYAGRAGVITSTDAGGGYQVFIDDCCQPIVAAAQLRRVRRRDMRRTIRAARESDPLSEQGRATAEIRDWVDSIGP